MDGNQERFEVYPTRDRLRRRRFNWRLVAGNGRIVCQSTQGFRDPFDARRSIEQVSALMAGRPPIVETERAGSR